MRRIVLLGVLVLGAVAGFAAPVVTIYTAGFGYIVDTQSVDLATEGELLLTNLPLSLLVDSIVLTGITATWISPVRAHPPAIEDLLGSTVTVFAGGERFQGRLLATGPRLVLATREGLLFLSAYDRIVAALPTDPVSAERLGLGVRYRNAQPGRAAIGVRYLAQGLSWTATYAATLGETTLDLRGMATLENATGVEFLGAAVTLVAGDVYRPTARAPQVLGVRALAAFAEMDAAPAFEYHRYALPAPVDLTPGVALVPLVAGELAYTRAYRFAGGPVEVRVRFVNALAPLPAGEVRVYDGDLFVGAAPIGHTPVGENVDLAIGAAFDLTGERVHEARQRLADDLYRDTYRITVRSAKDTPAVVEVVETLFGTWTVTRTTVPYERLDAQRVLFRVQVPAGGTAEVRYTVEWRN